MGPFKTNIVRIKLTNTLVHKYGMRRSKARDKVNEILDEALIEVISYVASKYNKLEIVVQEFGDGKLLEQFLAFINEHWDEILAIFLKLIGL